MTATDDDVKLHTYQDDLDTTGSDNLKHGDAPSDSLGTSDSELAAELNRHNPEDLESTYEDLDDGDRSER